MPEVIVKYKSKRTLQALYDMAKIFDMTIETPVKEDLASAKNQKSLPITFAKKPNVTALAGIWEGRDITLEELRKEAWGDRI